MNYFRELLYLIAFSVAILFFLKGLYALSKIVVAKTPAPNGLKEFVAS